MVIAEGHLSLNVLGRDKKPAVGWVKRLCLRSLLIQALQAPEQVRINLAK